MNHLNKINKIKTSFFSSSKIIRASSFAFVAAVFLMSGFFALEVNAVVSGLTVTVPSAGEKWGGGSKNITWTVTSAGPGDLVNIALITVNPDGSDNSSTGITTNVSATALSYNWTNLPNITSGANYRIRILDATTSFEYDTSDTFTIDNTPPTITSRVTLDTNGDGNVDQLNLVFSESVRDSSFSAASFTIDGQPGTSIVTGTPNDNTFSVLFGAVTGTNKKSVTYTAGTGTDVATPGNLLATNTQTATDSAAPVFLSAKTKTTTTIDLTFSEDLDSTTVTNSGFTVFSNVLTAPDAFEVTPGVVRITLNTPIGTGDTPNVTLIGPVIKDPAGNNAVVPVTKTPTDGIPPVLSEVTPVTTPTLDDTPDYTFSSSEVGTISYGGGCSSATIAATPGNNTITFNTLSDGTYNSCTITITDSSVNVSAPLAVSSFQVDITPVEVTNITTTEPDALQIGINPPFSPPLGSSLLRASEAFYAIRAISIVDQSISNVQWKITIKGPAGFTPDMVDLDEVGWSDIGPNPDSTDVFHYSFTGNGTLVATGSCTNPDDHSNSCTTDFFDVDPTDNFKNVDRVNFAAMAPLGTYTIKRVLVLDDGTPVSNELDVATFTVVNNLPILDAIGDQIVDEETLLTFTATANDVEGSPLSFTLVGAPTGASINGLTGVFTWTPTETQGGNQSTAYSFTVQVTDADGEMDNELIQVTVNEVNIAPVATNSPVSTNEDIPLLVTLPAADADIPANVLTYFVVDEPAHGTLGTVTGNQITYVPDLDYFGPDSFTFKVYDGTAYSNMAAVNIAVNALNDAPELAAISNQAVVAGNLLTFTAISTDVDGGAPIYSLDGNPVGSSINSSTGQFSWTPTVAGVYSFDVVVSDGNGGTDSQTVQVTVNHAAIAKLVISAEPTNLSVENQSTITVTGKDQFNNITTGDNSTIVILSADNGGALGTTLLTLTNGLAETTLSKSSAGDVHISASSGVLTPSQVTVTFNDVPGDITPPTILSYYPADDSTNVSVGATPFLVFSEPLKSSTVNSANIQIKKYSDNSVVPATVSLVEGGTQVNIDPTSPLQNDTQYYFAVSTGVKDEVGNPLATALDASTKADHEFNTVAVVPIVVDEIIAQNSTAAATDSYLAGWHYTFRITVNTAETNLSVKFADWINSASSTETVAANGNMRLLFNTATGNGLGSIVGLTDGDIISGVGPISSFALGKEYADQLPGAINLTGLDISTDPGRQIKFDVFTKLPVTTAPGFYETVFGIQVNNL